MKLSPVLWALMGTSALGQTLADSPNAAIGQSGFGIYSFTGTPSLGYLDGSGKAKSVPIAPLELPSIRAGGSLKPRGIAGRFAEHLSVADFGAACDGIADDSVALANAADTLANSGAELDIPGTCRLRLAGARQVWLRGTHLRGPHVRELGAQPVNGVPYAYGSQGGAIIIDTPTLAAGGVSPFLVSADWSLEGLDFFWPGQTEYTVAGASGTSAANGGAIAFAPLIAAHGAETDPIYSWSFTDNQVENAYDIADFTRASDVGHYHWERNQEFALRYHVHLRAEGGEAWITNNQFSFVASLYLTSGTNTAGPNGSQSPFYLRTFASKNAEIIHVDGRGSATVDGLRFNNNYALGLRFGLHATGGGGFNITTLSDNGFDLVSTPLQADHGAGFYSVTVTGGTWLCQGMSGGFVAPCVSIVASGGTVGNRLSLVNVKIGVTAGPAIVFHDDSDSPDPTNGVAAPTLGIVGGEMLAVGNINSGNPFPAVDFNAPAGALTIAALPLATVAAGQSGAHAIVIGGARTASMSGLTFGGWNVPLVVNTRRGVFSLTNSLSYATTAPLGTSAVLGPGAALVAQAGNVWDKAGVGSNDPPTSLSPNSRSVAKSSCGVDSGGALRCVEETTDGRGARHITADGKDTKFDAAGVTSGGFGISGIGPGVSCSGVPTATAVWTRGIRTRC